MEEVVVVVVVGVVVVVVVVIDDVDVVVEMEEAVADDTTMDDYVDGFALSRCCTHSALSLLVRREWWQIYCIQGRSFRKRQHGQLRW
jgi:hypothetical protein